MADVAPARTIVLAPEDNVVVTCASIEAGGQVDIEGQTYTLDAALVLGHKLTRRDIAMDEKILRYGAPIGHATAAIKAGDHVHIHNVDSDYLHSAATRDEEGADG